MLATAFDPPKLKMWLEKLEKLSSFKYCIYSWSRIDKSLIQPSDYMQVLC